MQIKENNHPPASCSTDPESSRLKSLCANNASSTSKSTSSPPPNLAPSFPCLPFLPTRLFGFLLTLPVPFDEVNDVIDGEAGMEGREGNLPHALSRCPCCPLPRPYQLTALSIPSFSSVERTLTPGDGQANGSRRSIKSPDSPSSSLSPSQSSPALSSTSDTFALGLATPPGKRKDPRP